MKPIKYFFSVNTPVRNKNRTGVLFMRKRHLADNFIRTNLALCGTFLFLAFLIWMGGIRSGQETLAERISPYVLRFHILANSNTPADQEVKLEIRSLILDYMQKQINPEAGKSETQQWLMQQKNNIETLADQYLNDHGFAYHTKLQLTRCYFPSRTYGSFTFPCGFYDAARITLGSGNGHNWWCILYPRFCFLDASCSGVSAESEAKLRCLINQGDFLALEEHRPDIKIRFKLLSFFNPR